MSSTSGSDATGLPDFRSPPSRAGEFFKGVFLPLAFALLGRLTYFPLHAARGFLPEWDVLCYWASPAMAVGGSFVLVLRWWRPLRWRAYGVLYGCVGFPATLAVLVVLFLVIVNPQLFPK
jgi:hypothetical protein